MQENKEISALFHLIDDTDEDVFSTISEKIVSLGRGIIPNLEHYGRIHLMRKCREE